MTPFLFDPVLSLLPLLVGLHFGGDGADLDLLQRRREVGVERKGIGWIDIATGRMFLQDLELCTGQGLEMPLELIIVNRRGLLDFLQVYMSEKIKAQIRAAVHRIPENHCRPGPRTRVGSPMRTLTHSVHVSGS